MLVFIFILILILVLVPILILNLTCCGRCFLCSFLKSRYCVMKERAKTELSDISVVLNPVRNESSLKKSIAPVCARCFAPKTQLKIFISSRKGNLTSHDYFYYDFQLPKFYIIIAIPVAAVEKCYWVVLIQ